MSRFSIIPPLSFLSLNLVSLGLRIITIGEKKKNHYNRWVSMRWGVHMLLGDEGGRSRWNYCVTTEQPKECHKLFLNFLICEKKKPTLFNSLLFRHLLVREKCISVRQWDSTECITTEIKTALTRRQLLQIS